MAATVSFVTYTATAHDFNVAVIFSSFSLFQVNDIITVARHPADFGKIAAASTSDVFAACTVRHH